MLDLNEFVVGRQSWQDAVAVFFFWYSRKFTEWIYSGAGKHHARNSHERYTGYSSDVTIVSD